MPTWGIFYFLWDDPLFTNLSSIEEWELKDPQFIELRRTMRLELLDWLYQKIEILQQQLAREKAYRREAEAREFWIAKQFLKLVPPDEAQRILIDRKVNIMDPDFSFEAALTK
jgi:hypothetical protein